MERPGLGALPRPNAHPRSLRPAPATHWLSVRGVWAWRPLTNPTARALASRLCALLGRQVDARGGVYLPGCGASGFGRSPTPDRPSLGRAAGARYPLTVGARVWAWGPVTYPTARALASWRCTLWGRHEGSRGAVSLAWAWGLPGWALSHAQQPILGACGRTRYPLAVGGGGVGVATSQLPHSARSCELALRAVEAARGRLEGGGSCLGVGHPELGAVSHPTACPWGVQLGLATHWLWVRACECGNPSQTTQRALLRAGFARYWGGTRLPRGGAPTAWVWRVQGSALSHAIPPVLGARGQGPLPTGCGCGGYGRGDPSPTPQRALLPAGFARCGGGTLTRAWGVRCRALSHARPPVLLACGRARYPLALGAGCVGMETRHHPPARAFLRSLGAARGRSGGGASCLGVGRPGLGALPRPTALPWGVRPGPATHWLWVRGVWAWGPVTNPAARARARCRGGTRAPGGGGPLSWVWGTRGWALSHGRLLVFGACGRGPLPTGCGCGFPSHLLPCGRLACVVRTSQVCATLLAPVLVPCLWPTACLPGVPHGRALVRRTLSRPVALPA